MFSALTDQIARSDQHDNGRGGASIDHIILHHSAATDAGMVVNMMVTGSREVSSNYVIGNDGTIYGVVDEENRAYTSGSSSDGGKGAAWDRRSITFECADLSTEGWTISDASYEAIAAVCADVSTRYGFPLVRDGANSTVFGHRELWEHFHASYPTACPGGMDVDRVVARANQIKQGGNAATQGEEDMAEAIIAAPNGQVVHFMPGQRTDYASVAEYNDYRSFVNAIIGGQSGNSGAQMLTPPPLSDVVQISWDRFITLCKHFGVPTGRPADQDEWLKQKFVGLTK